VKRSEEQKNDLKMKVGVGITLAIVGGLIYFLGPGLPTFLEEARKNREKPGSAERMYNVAKLMSMTMRDKEAQEIYDEMYLHYSGYDWEVDFEPVMEELGYDDYAQAFYLPWIMERFDGLPGDDDPDIRNPRPKPVSKEPHPLLGKVLYEKAMHFERERNYFKSNHIWSVLYNLWPSGSWENVEAGKARKRAMQRSFN
jgi:hypothetical protein